MTHQRFKLTCAPIVAAALAVVLLYAQAEPAMAGDRKVITRTVEGSFDKTVTKLKKAITASKMVIVKQVPYTKMIAMVGVKAEKTVGLEIFHPRYGKVIYSNDKDAMLEAPMRFLVRDEGGKVSIRYYQPSTVLAGYNGLSKLGAELDAVFEKIVSSVAK